MMKLIRYILSHGLLLAFLVVLGFAYYYRTTLFSYEVNQHIDQAVGVVLDKTSGITEVFRSAETKTEEQPVATATSEPEPAPAQQTEEQPVVTATTTPVEEQGLTYLTPDTDQPVQTEQVQAETMVPPVEQQQTGTVIPATSDTEVAIADRQNTQTDTQETVAEQPATTEAPISEETAQQIEPVPPKSNADLIGEARQAFQTGNPDKAIQLYQELSKLNPDDPNVFGELGNIFYSQGKWKQAGSAYYEAASLLLDQGQAGQVQYLYRVIQGLDQESAEKLKAKLNR